MLKFNYEFTKCPLCGRPPSDWIGWSHVLLNENHLRVMDETTMDYVMCKCGMGFAARYFDEDQARRFYEQGDYRYSTAVGSREVEQANIDEEMQRANLILPIITNYLPTCGSALDVGCSTGILLERIQRQYKCQVVGVEPSINFCDYVWEHHNIRCVQELYTHDRKSYDLITAIHLLEHLIDPMAMLVEIHKRLAPGGVFVVEVPFFQMMLGHAMLFTMTTLATMLTQAGYNDINFEKGQHIIAVARINGG